MFIYTTPPVVVGRVHKPVIIICIKFKANFCRSGGKHTTQNSPSTGKVQRVDETQGGSSSGTTRCQVTGEVGPELVLVNSSQEDLLVLVLECEVQSLGWKVSDHVGCVTTPVCGESLLLGDTHETVNHTWKTREEEILLYSVLGN